MKQALSLLAALFAVIGCCAWQGNAASAPGASIHASVVDFQTRAPLAQVRVSVFGERATKPLASTLTDKQGVFTLGALGGGLYRLQLTKAGYHETMVAGLSIKPGEHMAITGPIGMFSEKVQVPTIQISRNPCKDLVIPGQTADVYVVCGNR